MAYIQSDKTLIYGTNENDIIVILNDSQRVTVYGGDGDDGIEQPGSNENLNVFFDGGNGFDTLNLKLLQRLNLSFIAETKLIGGRYSVEMKVSGADSDGYKYNATVVNGEAFWLFGFVDDYYNLLDRYLPLYNITGPVAVSMLPSGSVSNNPTTIALQTFYDVGTFTFGSARDVVTFWYGTDLIANLGAGEDMATFEASSFGSIDGGSGIDTYVFGVYEENNRTLLASGAKYDLTDTGTLALSFSFTSSTLYLRNFEQIVFSDRLFSIVTGSAGPNSLQGSDSRASVVAGGKGNDTIKGIFGGDELAGGQGDDLITAGYSLSNATLGQNKINNGSFEFNATLPGRWAYKNNIVGWDSLRFDGRNWVRGGQMEVWNNFFMQKASDGTSLIEIDANDRYNGIGQTVRGLTKDIQYQLSFDLTARERANAETLDVYWNNRKLGEFKAVSRGGWTTYTTIVTASGNAAGDMLRFLELAGENNGRGVLLDNVKLQQVTLSNTPNRLDGGTGRDTLVGSIGADVFVFDIGDTGTTRTTADVIRQFTSGQDVVDIVKIAEGRELQFGGNAFSPDDFEPEIITQNVTGGVLALIDSDGDNRANAALFFEGVSRLAARDFKFA